MAAIPKDQNGVEQPSWGSAAERATYAPSAPTSAPAVNYQSTPTVTPRAPGGSYINGPIGNQQAPEAGNPYYQQSQQSAPAAPAVDNGAYTSYLQNMANEQARQNKVIEQLNRDQFNLEQAKSNALNAYNTSLLQQGDKKLAQDAFDSTILQAYQTRQNEIATTGQANQVTQWGAENALAGQAQASQVAQFGQTNMLAGAAQAETSQYHGQQIALQQGEQRVALRARQPFRSARIREVA